MQLLRQSMTRIFFCLKLLGVIKVSDQSYSKKEIIHLSESTVLIKWRCKQTNVYFLLDPDEGDSSSIMNLSSKFE